MFKFDKTSKYCFSLATIELQFSINQGVDKHRNNFRLSIFAIGDLVFLFLNVLYTIIVVREILGYKSWTLVWFWEKNLLRTLGEINVSIEKHRKKWHFFSITHQFFDEPFSSSNSIEPSMRRLYVQDFIAIELPFQELSCKRTGEHTDRF